MTTQQPDARSTRRSGATALTAAGIGAFLTALWVVPALLGFTHGGRHTADDVLLVEIIISAVPLAVGAYGTYQRRPYGRWVLLAGFVLGIPESLPVLIIVGVVASIPVAKVAGAAAALLCVTGLVLVSLRSTGRYLATGRVAGIPVR